MFNFFGKKKREQKSNQTLFGTMLAFGIVGLIASFVLIVEEFNLLKDPNASLSCSFNLVLNCGVVMKTWQASVFGFPNMLMGLIGFPIIITMALLGLSNVKFPRWFLIGAQIGIVSAALFAYWLFFSSVYNIQVLCPWCLTVTFSMTMLLAVITRHNIMSDTFKFSKKVNKKVRRFFEKEYDILTIAIWVIFLISLVIVQFGDTLFV